MALSGESTGVDKCDFLILTEMSEIITVQYHSYRHKKITPEQRTVKSVKIEENDSQ